MNTQVHLAIGFAKRSTYHLEAGLSLLPGMASRLERTSESREEEELCHGVLLCQASAINNHTFCHQQHSPEVGDLLTCVCESKRKGVEKLSLFQT